MFLKSVLLLIMVALSVGFYTMVERKILSYMQSRKGPNKVAVIGIVQPLSDALKLFLKEDVKLEKVNWALYNGAPMFGVFIMFLIWGLYGFSSFMSVMSMGVLYLMVVSSINVFSVLFSGWASNSKYSMLGAIRSIAQTISYEISMALVLMVFLLVCLTLNFSDLYSFQWLFFLVIMLPVVTMWLIIMLAETNRAPFDLSEGESELVSGYNVEYGGGKFSLLFIAEYGSILILGIISTCLCLGGYSGVKYMMVIIFFLWVRASYPRMRYDMLMSLTWKSFLLISLSLCSLVMCVYG